MNVYEIGKLIRKLRIEHNLTQKQLAQKIHVSEQAVSKWECGKGCPEVSLMKQLSTLFQIPINNLLLADLCENEKDRGNIKKLKFYVCPICGNLITTSSGTCNLACCGRVLNPQLINKAKHSMPNCERIEHELYFTMDHEMSKQHYISFMAIVSNDRFQLVKLYPEQDMQVRFPFVARGTLYVFCNKDGLLAYDLDDLK